MKVEGLKKEEARRSWEKLMECDCWRFHCGSFLLHCDRLYDRCKVFCSHTRFIEASTRSPWHTLKIQFPEWPRTVDHVTMSAVFIHDFCGNGQAEQTVGIVHSCMDFGINDCYTHRNCFGRMWQWKGKHCASEPESITKSTAKC
jgi:hypothetical protein